MASFEKEKMLTAHLLRRLNLDDATTSDPNTNQTETGLDVLVHGADGRVVGVQVTEIDPHAQAGKARGEEKKTAGSDPAKVYFGWGQNDPQVILGSLFRSISRKVAIADRHSFASVHETWLLVCAGIPEHGSVVSTLVVTQWLSVSDLNSATHSILQKSKYDRCFFLAILGTEQALYTWEKNSGWDKSVRLEDINEVPRASYESDLRRAASAGDWQEVDRLCDEECERVLREMRGLA